MKEQKRVSYEKLRIQLPEKQRTFYNFNEPMFDLTTN